MRLIILAVASLMMAACTQKTVEEKLAEYNAWEEQFMNDYLQGIQALMASGEEDEEVVDKNVQAYADKMDKEYLEYNKKVIKDNKGNAVSLAALKNINYDLQPEEIIDIIENLDETTANDPSAVSLLQGAKSQKNTAEGLMFTDFEVDGVKLSDFVGKGKYVLVDFWASWCGPCRREMPNLRKVYEAFKGEKFDMLSVAVWDKPEDTAKAAEEENIVWSQIVNAQRIPTDIYGIQGIPHIILFGPDGTIIKRNLRGEGIYKTVEEYVK